jgi:hypothetical protein
MFKSGNAGKFSFEDLMYGFCDFLWGVADKLDGFAANMKLDTEIAETLPRKYVEKKRKTQKPSETLPDFDWTNTTGVSGHQIRLRGIPAGFSEESILSTKNRIAAACKFILGNAESKTEKHLAAQLAKLLWKGAVSAGTLEGKRVGTFYGEKAAQYITLDIAAILNTGDAELVDTLAHESYHAWRYFSSDVEYSVVDETRAWNAGLHFSNKYRLMHGIPVRRTAEYTVEEVLKRCAWNVPVNMRYGPGESFIEKAGYGLANIIENAVDVVEGWTQKIIDRT